MNHQLWTSVGTRVVSLAFVLAAATACGDKLSDVSSGHTPAATPPSPSAQVIGTTPAEPTGDTPQTTAVAGPKDELTKAQESKSMPLEGQDSSHMTEARKDSQRAGGSDEQTERRAK